MGPLLHFFGPFGAIFWPFRATFVVGIRFKMSFETTNVDKQLWFLKYSPNFLFSIRPNLGPFWAIFEVGFRFKKFLGPTYTDNQLWFWKYSHIFWFLIWPHLEPLLHVFGLPFGLLGLFLVGVWLKILFRIYMYIINFSFGRSVLSF